MTMNKMKLTLACAAISLTSLASPYAKAEEEAQQTVRCSKFEAHHESMMQEALTKALPDRVTEVLKGEICTNQNDTVLAQQTGGVIGSLAGGVGPAGPLLGLLFAIFANASSPEPAITIKTVVMVDDKLVRKTGTFAALSQDAFDSLASSAEGN